MVVLDTLDLLVEASTELGEAGGSTPQILSCALRVLLHILSKRQAVEVLKHVFALQRAIVAKVRLYVSDRASVYLKRNQIFILTVLRRSM